MGKQRNNHQMKGKEKASERMLTEKEELTDNYQKLQGNYNELTANYINIKKEIETMNKGQE